ncbi:MAG: NUDIX domain-containing protein [Croceibacterium sp.]
MKKIPTFVLVVAARIVDREGRVLVQRALPGKPHSGLWELPGGNVDNDELPRAALVREVAEELGIDLSPDTLEPAGFAEERATDNRPALVMMLYTCRVWRGEPTAREGQEWCWCTAAQSREIKLAAMDRSLLEAWLAESG